MQDVRGVARAERSADKHYKKWTDRYTLIKAWQFRSGFRFSRQRHQQPGDWQKNDDFEPLRMYVMDDSFKNDER